MGALRARHTSAPPGGHGRWRWLTGVSAAVLVVALATPSAAASTGAGAGSPPPAGSPSAGSGPVAGSGPIAKQPVSGKRSAKPLCSTEVARDHARCFGLVMETDGIVPHLDQPQGLSPDNVKSAYHLPDGGGAGAVIGIVDAYDNPNAESDLAHYRETFGLPPLADGQFTKVDQRGGTDYPAPNAGWAGEISLDLQAVTAVAPNASIILVEGDSASFDDLGTAVNTAIALGAKYVSNSYGTDYDSTPGSGEDSSLIPYEAQYYDHPGVVVTASSGDGDYGVAFPADSPHVTSVGGTSLVPDSSARGWSESVWNNSYGGPGSGCSIVFDKPAFQTDSGCDMRSVADVSAVADPETGLAVYNTYGESGWGQYGGTSLSSPLIAAIYALAGTPADGSYPNSYPYAHPEALNDVTVGSNGTCTPSYECTAGPGYDGPTGLGTPDGLAAFTSGPHGTVAGAVTDASTGDPVPGAEVTATSTDDGSTAGSAVTDSAGQYTLALPAGEYTLAVTSYGYATGTAGPVTVTDGGTVTADVALTKLATHTLSGTVTDGSGHGYPLYATITVDGVPGGPVYTDPFTGHYSVDLPAKTTYQLTVAANSPGYLATTVSVKVGGKDKVRNIKMKVDPSLDQIPGYTVTAQGSTETFDGTTAPDGWTVTDETDTPGWTFDDPGGRGNLTGGDGGFAIVDSDHAGIGTSEDSYLTSPVYDLSAAAAPTLEFDTYFKAISDSDGTVELSTDGGSTWSVVWDANETTTSGHVKLALPAGAATSDVQLRFHYVGSWAWYWEVDNVFVGTLKIKPVHGGLLAGIVTDANTGAGVNSAQVRSDADPSLTASTTATGDPAVGDGFYEMFSRLTGSQSLTATHRGYGSVTSSATVGANTTTRLDFSLPAGQVAVTPASIDKTLGWGKSKSGKLTLTNTGGLPATVSISEQAGGFVLASKGGAPTQVIKARTSTGSMLTALHKSAKPMAAAAGTPVPSADAWQPAADYPSTIQDNAAVMGNGVLYSVTGFDGTEDVSSLYSYDADAGAWTQLTAASDTREAAAAGFIGGHLVVSGGWGASGDPDGTTEIYDPAGDSWTTGADNPKPAAGAGHAVLNGKLYAVGGCSASACGSTTVQVYDAASDSWSSAADYPEAVSWEACGGIDGKLYCAGGTTDSGTLTHGYVYDPGSDSWSPIPDLPVDMWGSFYTAANGQLLVAGGAIEGGTAITNQGYAFDPASGQWSALPNQNAALYRGSGAVGFYAVGGNPGGFLVPPVATVEVLPGYDQGGSADVPWLSESTDQLTLDPGASATVTVTVNAADPSIVQPGAYTASLAFTTDTPYSVAAVPVTMTVTPPKSWGKIAGTVTSAADGSPIAGATVEIDSWATSYTLTTGADGSYALWLDKRNNPLTMIVAKDGFKPQTATVKITAGATVTKNWALLKR